jgi:DNA-binding MarR family transcriptional regulator
MTVTLPSSMVEALPSISAGAIKTYLALSTLKAAAITYPTQGDIASYMNASVRSVLTYLNELERAGYIERRRIGAGRRTDYMLLTTPDYAAG